MTAFGFEPSRAPVIARLAANGSCQESDILKVRYNGQHDAHKVMGVCSQETGSATPSTGAKGNPSTSNAPGTWTTDMSSFFTPHLSSEARQPSSNFETTPSFHRVRTMVTRSPSPCSVGSDTPLVKSLGAAIVAIVRALFVIAKTTHQNHPSGQAQCMCCVCVCCGGFYGNENHPKTKASHF